MKKYIFILSILLLWAPFSEGVSRVGGGKVSSLSSGFEMSAPPQFAMLSSPGAEKVRADGPPVYVTGRGVMNQFIDISEFRNEFADLTEYSSLELQERLSKSNWTVAMDANCVLILKNINPQITAYVATWGSGKGFVLKGKTLSAVDLGMQEMIRTLKLQPGSCAWK